MLAPASGPRLETERLILRVPRRDDFDGYAELFGDEEAARHVGGHMPRASAWRKFLQMPGAWALQGFGMFSVIEKASGRWLGQAGPWQPDQHNGTEVGWVFLRAYWGRGFATEAATAAIDWTFANLDWTDVIHNIMPANAASIALAERLGSRYRGTTRLKPPLDELDIGVWGQTREQWQARRAGECRS